MNDTLDIIKYKGYEILNEMKSIPKMSTLSGHRWTENKVLKSRFYISGKGARVLDIYHSVKSAKSHIDFLVKFKKELHL